MRYLFTILSFVLAPSLVFAQGQNTSISIIPESCRTGACDFNELIQVINNLGNIAMILTTTVATVMFVYAGFMYITSQGDPNKVKGATTLFRNVVIGFVIILAAYLLVKELLIKLGVPYLANLIS